MHRGSLVHCQDSLAPDPLEDVKRRLRVSFVGVAAFSMVMNILALSGSVYMLQIYDRVLPSRSIATLVGLSMLVTGLYAAYGILDFVRTRLLSRIGAAIDRNLRERVFAAVQLLPLRAPRRGDGLEPIRDLDSIRGFLSGLGPPSFLDLPWVPIYLVAVSALHPLLGLFAAAGALVLVAMTLLTEWKTRRPLEDAAASRSERLALGQAARRNCEVVRAMGLGPRLEQKWTELSRRHVAHQLAASDAVGGIGSLSRVMRLFMQSGILGIGALLVIRDEVSAGTIVAASIIMSRALAPIEQVVAHWRGFISTWRSWWRLSELFRTLGEERLDYVDLPPPHKSVVVENLTVAPPGTARPVIRKVSFVLQAGEGLGVIGPSASGKSTLARALVGVWPPHGQDGALRIDGAALDQWRPAELGRQIGYLPQDIELFRGTVAENIARFEPRATSEAIVAAAEAASVHDMILRLPAGYQTEIGEGGSALSAGQRQRIALARALYGNPFLIVLDEPNSNLDSAGDEALTRAIHAARRRGAIVIVVAHRPSALAVVDKILVLANGQVQAFGPKDDIVRTMAEPRAAPRSAPPHHAFGSVTEMQSAGIP